MSRSARPLAVAGLATVLASGGAAAHGAGLRGAELYRQPGSRAALQVHEWRATRPADARLLERISRRPQASWLGEWTRDPRGVARRLVDRASVRGQVALLVAYAVPDRDCGGHSTGGLSARGYRRFVRHLAAGIGTRRAVVILEPDALAGLGCLRPARQRLRMALLSMAVRTLGRHTRALVYVDAGHAHWNRARTIAHRLRRIAGAEGFSLNVANFGWTRGEAAFGRRVSRLAGGMGFVIDTSRNGRGPDPLGRHCNPAGRGLGPPPTTRPREHGVDAYLWVKGPGFSDGPCNGGPPAGGWWPDYALGLAARGRSASASPWSSRSTWLGRSGATVLPPWPFGPMVP